MTPCNSPPAALTQSPKKRSWSSKSVASKRRTVTDASCRTRRSAAVFSRSSVPRPDGPELVGPRVHGLEGPPRQAGVLGQVDAPVVPQGDLVQLVQQR